VKRVAVVQSNYIPWKGYFDLIAAVDEFILYDDVQYTRRDWRNRNKIITSSGTRWLTVPVYSKGCYQQKIDETKIKGTTWAAAHWKSLEMNYCRAPCFEEVADWLRPLYLNQNYKMLSKLNRRFLTAICQYLDIDTQISRSQDYTLVAGRSERLVDLCMQAGATEYLSGPAARAYVEPSVFQDRDMSVQWFDYSGYPGYPQLWGANEHAVSIVDLLFNCGKDSHSYMKCAAK
jgi:hypothetical protein